MRSQARHILYGVVIVLIALASIIEPPGTVEAIGYAVVIVALLAAVLRERRKA
jgi:hypothetical protein